MSKLIDQDDNLAKDSDVFKWPSTTISRFIATWVVNEYSLISPATL